jgi:predicted dehydrogenase
VGLGQAGEMTALARSGQHVNAVGLQARGAPAIRYAAELVESGYVGELQSVLLTASNPQPGGRVLPTAWGWHAERENWLSPLTIPGGHALDAVRFCAGDIVSVAAEVATLNPMIDLVEGGLLERTADDHVAMAGRLASGALLSVQINGGTDVEAETVIELRGTEGMLRVRTATATQLQMGPLVLQGGRRGGSLAAMTPPASMTRHIPAVLSAGPGENLAGIYTAVRDAICGDGRVLADFADALATTQLIEDVQKSAATERRIGTGQRS